MKRFITPRTIFLLLTMLMNSNESKSQFTPGTSFVHETVPYCNNGNFDSVINTGNDAQDGNNVKEMKVNVWDGINPGLGWQYDNGLIDCHMSLPINTFDPDVVLIEIEGLRQSPLITWFAIVVYEDASSGALYCDIYEYDLANNTFASPGYSTHNQIASSANGRLSSINIDAVSSGYYVIVWDDINGNGIWAIEGSAPIAPSGTAVNSIAKGESPDVALLQRASNNIGIYVTFIDNSGSEIHVNESHSNSGLNFGSAFWNYNGYILPTNHTYSHPRIACPAFTVCGKEWTIVFEDKTASTNDISSVSMWCYGPGYNGIKAYNYTDGGANSPMAINSGNNNIFPVITYDNSNRYKIIGWETDYPTIFNSIPTLIAINCNYDGTFAISCSPDYLIVPKPYHDGDISLSVSGRYFSKILYTFYEYGRSDIMFKDVVSCSSALRHRNPESTIIEDSDEIDIIPNPFTERLKILMSSPFDETIQVKISNISGANLFLASGKPDEINKLLEEFSSVLPNGVYFSSIEYNFSGKVATKKLIKLGQ